MDGGLCGLHQRKMFSEENFQVQQHNDFSAGSQSAEICCCGEAPGNDNNHNLCIQNGGHCSENKQDRERERERPGAASNKGLAAHD